MIFVDTNVFMYAVGRDHPLRPVARRFFEESKAGSERLFTSAEILQELMHAYIPVGRIGTLDAARSLVAAVVEEVWSIEPGDVDLARDLLDHHKGLGARDLLHLACCQRRGVTRLKTFDRSLSAAFA